MDKENVMIHQIFNLTRLLFVIDAETTGTDTQQDRIVELGFQQWEAIGLIKEWRTLVNPGIPIPPASTEIHHITDAMVQGCRICLERGLNPPTTRGVHEGAPDLFDHEFHPWPTFKQLATHLARGFINCDYCGKHVRFDLRIIAAEFQREGAEWSYADARIVDADRLEQLGEPRTLADLYKKHLGREMEDAHAALSDVRATTELIAAQLAKYQQLPRDLDLLHALQWPNFIDPEGKFRFVDGVACVSDWGKHKGKPMWSVPVDYWDFILGADFSAEVKALARKAKLGEFPEGK